MAAGCCDVIIIVCRHIMKPVRNTFTHLAVHFTYYDILTTSAPLVFQIYIQSLNDQQTLYALQ
jgi:hypothetical protein